MFKSRGVVLGATVALVGAALLIAGMAVGTTSGAGTDFGNGNYGAPTGGFPDATGNPPASGGETPGTPGTQPGAGNPVGAEPGTPGTQIDPTGGAGAGAGGPGGLPNAGFGVADSGNGSMAMIVLLALTGAALVGAGAASVSAGRRD